MCVRWGDSGRTGPPLRTGTRRRGGAKSAGRGHGGTDSRARCVPCARGNSGVRSAEGGGHAGRDPAPDAAAGDFTGCGGGRRAPAGGCGGRGGGRAEAQACCGGERSGGSIIGRRLRGRRRGPAATAGTTTTVRGSGNGDAAAGGAADHFLHPHAWGRGEGGGATGAPRRRLSVRGSSSFSCLDELVRRLGASPGASGASRGRAAAGSRGCHGCLSAASRRRRSEVLEPHGGASCRRR